MIAMCYLLILTLINLLPSLPNKPPVCVLFALERRLMLQVWVSQVQRCHISENFYHSVFQALKYRNPLCMQMNVLTVYLTVLDG
jgi:hypothetical protein